MPLKLGSSDGWMFSSRPSYRLTNAGVRMRMKPARTTRSGANRSISAASAASKLSRPSNDRWSTTAVATRATRQMPGRPRRAGWRSRPQPRPASVPARTRGRWPPCCCRDRKSGSRVFHPRILPFAPRSLLGRRPARTFIIFCFAASHRPFPDAASAIVKVFRGLPNAESRAPCALTIGNFDGVHRGHWPCSRACAQRTHAACPCA